MGKYDYTKTINGQEVPFKIFIERRRSVRVSFGRSCINLRLPSHLTTIEREHHLDKAILWVKKHADKNPNALDQYKVTNYDEVKSLKIYDTELNLRILYEDRKTGKADYEPKTETIIVVLPRSIEGFEKSKMIKQLQSRICAQIFKPHFETRVREINDKCFHKEIKSINLKYNKSNWGSCSSAANLNFSTRLLFAPKPVRDYVIIHELSHLLEMNHSPKFWNIVSQVMPNYKQHERWLKQNGKSCDF